MILRNLIYNIIILYFLTYILKVRKKRSTIILATVVGAYRIFIPLVPDIIMYFIVFKKDNCIIKIVTEDEILYPSPFMDTGCTLKYFDKPVIILNENLLKSYKTKYYVPYKTVDSTGILKIIEVKKVLINKKHKNVLVGVLKMDEIELIMNPKIMEEIL